MTTGITVLCNQVNTRDSRKLWWNLDSLIGRQKIDSNKIEVEENGKLHKESSDVANAFNNSYSTCVDNLRSKKEVWNLLLMPQKYPRRTCKLNFPQSTNHNWSPRYNFINEKQFCSWARRYWYQLTWEVKIQFPDELKIAKNVIIGRVSAFKYLGRTRMRLNSSTMISLTMNSLLNPFVNYNCLQNHQFYLKAFVKRVHNKNRYH